jgi:transcription antitermination factor NusG
LMTDALPGRMQAREPQFTVGESVQITRGVLAGMGGIVHGFVASRRCVLDISGLAEGVQIVISCDAITRSNFCIEEVGRRAAG